MNLPPCLVIQRQAHARHLGLSRSIALNVNACVHRSLTVREGQPECLDEDVEVLGRIVFQIENIDIVLNFNCFDDS